ncbi:MAG: hypothetical protein NVSMB46_05940 [Candidatus Saccharimonadales bacterium]
MSSVIPGTAVTTQWNATALAKSGIHNFQWQLTQSGNVFGSVTANVSVGVSCTMDDILVVSLKWSMT